MAEFRIEKDSMGEVRVPAQFLYGAQTQRALENFQISGQRFPRVFIRALGLIKQCCAQVNEELGLLEPRIAQAIRAAAAEVAEGKLDDHFPLDIFQTGSGTSTNMNANEVIANRAIQLLGGEPGSRLVHPNNHVNMGQSSNDVIPTALHVAAALQIREVLYPGLRALQSELDRCAREWDDIVTTGRTHLMDAMPIRLGQRFSGYATQVAKAIQRIEGTLPRLHELAIGGTAVGTGVNTPADFGARVAAALTRATGLQFREAENHFEAQACVDTAVEVSGQLKTAAVALIKIANDLRWMNSGPLAGLGEIRLPELQPGSSIMPGKVNPVIPEVAMQVGAQVCGNDVAIALGGQHGNFELNTMLPLVAKNLLESITLLGNAARALAEKALAGTVPNRERMEALVERNPILATVLAPRIGYDRAAEVVKLSQAQNRTVREVALELGLLSPEELDAALDVRAMTERGFRGGGGGG